MDKKLSKKASYGVFIIFICVVLFSGCETAKGFGSGVACGVSSIPQGVSKDSFNLWQSILKADDWVKKNLW